MLDEEHKGVVELEENAAEMIDNCEKEYNKLRLDLKDLDR